MKETLTNANFPRDAQGRVYHLSLKEGEVANRILTVGDHVRARAIARHLDTEEECGHKIFENVSQRGFTTITGRYKGVPVTILAIGMGNPMMDFFVREVRAVTKGPIAIIRFGSCGSLNVNAPPGSVVVPYGGYCIRRNLDYFAEEKVTPQLDKPYLISGVFKADAEMTATLERTMKEALAPVTAKNDMVGPVVAGGLNADGCSFYSSQGRLDPTFWDDNEEVIQDALSVHPTTNSLEMETSMLFHLAHCVKDTDRPIRAAGCMQVFADRVNNGFISPDVVGLLEPVAGRAVLEALIQTKIEEVDEKGTVWERK
ncbi:nucleoside phosphorylase domain-containing protein [Radiomyces spectabilis]|uniref:nucleoside phosphorylase domain-containing protein n=1 Tax=Radiomyces spectabilis TaxID=64574 RepID=UPI00221F6495|nr:nucleoside phosphorylase domain-containing protein [Radiomyces spectabilis]KAI8379547.1 nucleoside phosphorylase domain-containing protein [Radiomyces spectabilis]